MTIGEDTDDENVAFFVPKHLKYCDFALRSAGLSGFACTTRFRMLCELSGTENNEGTKVVRIRI